MVFQTNNVSICEGYVRYFTGKSNFYSQVMEDNPYRYVLATISIVIMIASLITCYSIIWIERFGSDKKRTIINQLVASMCWSFITWNSTVQVLKLVRLLHGPLGLKSCVWTFILQRSVTTRILLLVNAISTIRYTFIFWLKNPGAFNDDFWHRFVSLWTIMAGSLFQYVIASLPNRKLIGVDVCMGLPTNNDINSPTVNIGAEIPSLILQLFIFVHITIHQRKLKNKPLPLNSSNRVNVCKIFTFPFYLIFLFAFLIFAPLVSFIIPFSLYFLHPHVRQTIAREWQGFLLALKARFF